MPNVTVYVRTGDMEAWRNLRNKSQAIHDMLANSSQPPAPVQHDRLEYLGRTTQERREAHIAAHEQGKQAARQPTHTNLGDPINDKSQEVFIPHKGRTATKPAPADLTAKLPPEIRGAFVNANSIPPKPPQPAQEQACCKEPSPCKHWVWDINQGDGYVNTISGRKKVTE